MSSSAGMSQGAGMSAVAPLSWTVWPLRKKPALGLLALACIAGAVWGVDSITDGIVMPAFAGIVLAISVAPFFVRTTYRLTPEGVEVTRLGRVERRPWSSFRRVRASEEIVQLSTLPKPSWLDAYRSYTILLDGNRAEVVDYVERMVGKEGHGSASSGRERGSGASSGDE